MQSAYGRAQRTYAGFAERHDLPAHTFEPAPQGAPSTGVKGFVEAAVEAAGEADGELAALQDSMLPIEVGDAELRAGLQEVRELLGTAARTRPRAGAHAGPLRLRSRRSSARYPDLMSPLGLVVLEGQSHLLDCRAGEAGLRGDSPPWARSVSDFTEHLACIIAVEPEIAPRHP